MERNVRRRAGREKGDIYAQVPPYQSRCRYPQLMRLTGGVEQLSIFPPVESSSCLQGWELSTRIGPAVDSKPPLIRYCAKHQQDLAWSTEELYISLSNCRSLTPHTVFKHVSLAGFFWCHYFWYPVLSHRHFLYFCYRSGTREARKATIFFHLLHT
jgi:hypothetical protein